MRTLGETLREARIKKDMTIRLLAKVLNVREHYISDIERNVRTPAELLLFRMSDVLEIDINYLLMLLINQKVSSLEIASLKKVDTQKINLYKQLHEQHLNIENIFDVDKTYYYKGIRLTKKDIQKMYRLLDVLLDVSENKKPQIPNFEELTEIVESKIKISLLQSEKDVLIEKIKELTTAIDIIENKE
ncbi:helix-turn-helix domain-containing protein [Heyndrickxia sporothermodurans]|nr:helix-turn-helix transcriptional regulator [Heyndrickxia sporothermodurans]MEB6549662.1 helix-turn-helix domain-containing protein [Heyndrickxia sporothermodurans]